MAVAQYTELEYAAHLRDLIADAADEVNLALAEEQIMPITAENVIVGPPGLQVYECTVFVMPASRSYPESPMQAAHHVVDSTTYVEWARHVHAGFTVQVQVVMVPDAESVQRATRAVCRVTDVLERLFLRHIGEDGWWAHLDVEGVSEVAALRLQTVDQTIVAARQFSLTIRVKERVDTRPIWLR